MIPYQCSLQVESALQNLAVLLILYSAPVRHALGLLASLHWGLTLPQGRCGRWLLISYPGRLQMEGAKMVGGAALWRGQRMQEHNTRWDGCAAGLLSVLSL